MGHKTWKNIREDIGRKIRTFLLENNGQEVEPKNNELWRIKFPDSVFIYYHTHTLHSTPPKSDISIVFDLWDEIDLLFESNYISPTKEYLIGLDMKGKGEVIGHIVLTGVVVPKKIFNGLGLFVSTLNTKNRDFKYLDEVFNEIDGYRKFNLDFKIEKISPSDADKYKLNKILDVKFQKLLSTLINVDNSSNCRIVMNDYGIGAKLTKFFNFLENQGDEIVVSHGCENKYLESRVASIISKRTHGIIMKTINEDPNFQVNGLSIGSGSPSDHRTISWLKEWYKLGKEWPWFIKRSFKTIREIEGSLEVLKMSPPINDGLLSNKFIQNFEKGILSVKSLFVVCPLCGEISRTIRYNVSTALCSSCYQSIENLGTTLRYYSGNIIPDSNVIRSGLLSKDLENKKFFENFNIILPPIVRKECDSKGGKRELERLTRYASLGIIGLFAPLGIKSCIDGASSIERDEWIIESALDRNAMLITKDRGMMSTAVAQEAFTIMAK